MYYDITNPNTSYYWLHRVLQIKMHEFIEKYIIECHNDFDTFYEKYRSIIDKIDIENMEIVAFQVTSCSDECAEIKKYGLHNLQWVLSNDTNLNRFLKNNSISVYCKIELPKVADGNWRMLHLQIGESCKTFAKSSQERCSA